MSARIIALLAITGCASRTTVVELPAARPLPPLPPAEVVETEPPLDLQPKELTEIPTIDLDDSPIRMTSVWRPPPQPAQPRCANGSVAVGGMCLTPALATAPIPNGCTLVVNSIPQSHVLVDGVYEGKTPRVGVSRKPGTHLVMFITDDAYSKKAVTVQCAAGERKVVAVRVVDP